MQVMRRSRGRQLAFCAPALVIAIATLTIGPARAASAPRAATFGGMASLAAVSCRGAAWCMAVGGYTTTGGASHSLAMTWNGTSWRKLKNPPGAGMNGVSCSSRSFCMASGGPTGAERWTGAQWRTMPAPKGGLPGLTCASRTFCVRLHGNRPSVWNGTSWRDAKVPDFCKGGPPGPCGLASVACGSTKNCAAVGTQTVSQEPVQNAVADTWNGTKWSFNGGLPANGNPAQLNTVSCAGTFCMSAGVASNDSARASIAVGDKFDATSQTWTDVSPSLGGICPEFQSCAWAGAVACASSTSCITLGGMRTSQFWNGSGWTSAKPVSAGKGSALQDVSCGGTNCVAVGLRTVAGKRRTLAELWNGSAWAIVKTPM